MQKQKAQVNGRCFEYAFNALTNGTLPEGAALCHGIVHGEVFSSNTLTPHVHAWIELPGHEAFWCVDVSKGVDALLCIPCDTYYPAGHIDPAGVVKYSIEDARECVITHKHYGPWDFRLVRIQTKVLEKAKKPKTEQEA